MSLARTFIGRDRELLDVREILLRKDVRLLTLTGPPGVGKSRLAREAAQRLREVFIGGVASVDLGALPAASLLPVAAAQAFGLTSEGMGHPLQRLEGALEDRGASLLVLDDCEQLEGAAPALVALTAACPELKVLATSRQPLGLSWEYEIAARQVQPRFEVTPDNVQAVAELCAQLDGLPLALELAAARTKLLSPQAMLHDVRPRLELLSRIAADVPGRHQTMRGAIGWSYERLGADEREMFRTAAVFRGGWTVQAAAVVAARPVDDTWRLLEALVDRSLIIPQAAPPAGDPRFAMLEVLREFALEQLRAAGEFEAASSRHLDWCVRFAEEAAGRLSGSDQTRWLGRLAQDYGNLRAALALAAAAPSRAEHLVRLAAALWRWWNVRGHWLEGVGWCEAALAAAAGPHPLRGPLLHGTAVLAWRVGKLARAARYAEEAEHVCLAGSDRRTAAHALRASAVIAKDQGEMDRACELGERSLALFRELQDTHGIASALRLLGLIDLERQRFAPEVFEESLRLSAEMNDERGVAWSTYGRAAVAAGLGDLASGARLGEDSLRRFRAVGDTNGIATALSHLARIARRTGDPGKARALYDESLALRRGLGESEQVARLEEEMRNLEAGPRGTALTARELEVARLIGRGWSNRQIADALVISERTAQAHVQHILVKLGMHSRAEIAAWLSRLEAPSGR
jgi:predicted ATPase/DNA-binding CsgD family transcriptional regulator